LARIWTALGAVIMVAAGLAGGGSAWAAETNDPLDRYNVVWDKPAASDKEDASMPIGNGDIGMNVSVEANGDVVLLLSKPSATLTARRQVAARPRPSWRACRIRPANLVELSRPGVCSEAC
jgi:hypothetical protein